MSLANNYTDIDLLRVAAAAGAARSGDPHTQNGAVLAKAGSSIVASTNGIPAGLSPLQDRLTRPAKYQFIEHAERAVIYRAASMGWKTGGSTLYCPWFACPECARAIILAGIYEVVGHAKARAATPDRWLSDVLAGESMLRESGVGMRWLEGDLGVTVKFSGKEMLL